MTESVFFSWQADTDTKTGRNLVERALRSALDRVGSDATVDDAMRDLELDRDTQSTPGFPPIVETIFRKIDAAAIFVPDLTFVGKRLDGRPTPNPNVLIEYGWALRSLTHSRIVPIMNAYYGQPNVQSMPFDMRHLRHPITYNCSPDADASTVKRVKAELANKVEYAIRAVLASDEYRSSLLRSPQRSLFKARAPEGSSQGRFESLDIPIGIRDGRFSNIEVSLPDKPVIWLRVMPEFDPGKEWGIAELREIATYQSSHLVPHTRRWASLDYLRRSDGFGVYATTNASMHETPAIVVAFASGEIWSLDASYLEELREYKQIPAPEPCYPDALKQYGSFLSRLGIAPPYRWIAGMENLRGRGVVDPVSRIRPPIGPCIDDTLVCEGRYTPGESPELALRPFFARLFDACGAVYPANAKVHK